jgi:MFS family permease
MSASCEPPGGEGPPVSWFANTFSALSVRDYRLFFCGQTLSLTGSWMRRTALGWLVFQLTGSMTMLGTVFALTLFPMTVLSPIGGLLADRYDKRRIIILSSLVSMSCSTSLSMLIYFDLVQIWQLMTIAATLGVAFSVEVPARQAFVVELVGRDRLMNAIALNSANVNLTRIIGPSVAGLLMGTVGMVACFAIDAMAYLVVIGTLLMVHVKPRRSPARHAHPIAQLREGLNEVLTNRPVRLVLILLSITLIFGWSFQNLLAGIAQDELGLKELEFGVLASMFGVGAVFGALFVASRTAKRDAVRHLLIAMAIMASGLFTFSLSDIWWGVPSLQWTAWPLTALPLVATGFGGVMFLSTGNTLVQLSVADEIRGRVMGIWSIAWGSAFPIGGLLMGAISDQITAMWTIRISAILLAVACVWSASIIRARAFERARSEAARRASTSPSTV